MRAVTDWILAARALGRSALRTAPTETCSLCLQQRRHFRTSLLAQDVPKFRKDGRTSTTQFASSTKTVTPDPKVVPKSSGKPPVQQQNDAKAADDAAVNAKTRLKQQEDQAAAAAIKMGGLADNSIFSIHEEQDKKAAESKQSGKELVVQKIPKDPLSLEARNPKHLEPILNPRPTARSRWQRRMVIRDLRRRGRLTNEMKLARTERSHLAKSHFFKTSMKKLAPLARQIAGKPIDEAILQMRFSAKKAAIDVRRHLIMARDEAIVSRGMGLGLPSPSLSPAIEQPASEAVVDVDSSSSREIWPPAATSEKSAKDSATTVDTTASPRQITFVPDPSITPPLPNQTPSKTWKPGHPLDPTSIYVAQAWTNRGPYGKEPDYRAMGRLNILRPPHTGLSVLLKEEKTRTREKTEKEAKAIRRRMGKNMWTQLPDRKIQGPQGQYMHW